MQNKIDAARRLVRSIETDADLDWSFLDHPNESRALARLAADLDFRLQDDDSADINNVPRSNGGRRSSWR